MTHTAVEPRGTQVVTPAGFSIYKQEKPKRLYRLLPDSSDYAEWFDVPSVTTVLDALAKPLQWWGMEVGVAGVVELCRRGIIVGGDVDLWREIANGDSPIDADQAWGIADIVRALTQHKLTVNHDTGATTKGTNVHRALEVFANTGVVPDPQFYPEDERGFIEGLVAFINDAHPHTLHSELMVASMDDQWAGTLDWVVNLDFAGKVVTKTYQKKPEIRAQVSGSWIIDAKTSSEKPGKPKSVYPSYKIQGRAYERGFTESGYGVVDHFGVLRLTNDGRYELVESDATYDDFLAVLEVYRRLERIKGK